MSSPRIEVLLWARRIIAKKTGEAHTLLEVAADATVEEAQEAFHRIARIAHPDLHRTTLGEDDLEVVTSAYAHVANAYQQFRTQKLQTTKIAAVKPATTEPPRARRISLPGGGVIRGGGASPTRPPISTTSTAASSSGSSAGITPPLVVGGRPATPSTAPPLAPAMLVPEPPTSSAAQAAAQMNSRALLHWRKAELALRKGDARNGTLSIKMAIAADPQSSFLRNALAEIEAEISKKP